MVVAVVGDFGDGQGLGRACIRRLKQMAFRDLHGHSFWLDGKALNTGAQTPYDSEGLSKKAVCTRSCA